MIRGKGAQLALGALFFLSGAAALGVETTWLRWLRTLFGATAPAASATLVAFFAGHAVGAGLAARWLPRVRRPLLAYAGLEVAAMAFALAVPGALALGERLLLSPLPAQGDVFVLAARRFGLAIAVTLPAAACYGATLPVLGAAVLAIPGSARHHGRGVLRREHPRRRSRRRRRVLRAAGSAGRLARLRSGGIALPAGGPRRAGRRSCFGRAEARAREAGGSLGDARRRTGHGAGARGAVGPGGLRGAGAAGPGLLAGAERVGLRLRRRARHRAARAGRRRARHGGLRRPALPRAAQRARLRPRRRRAGRGRVPEAALRVDGRPALRRRRQRRGGLPGGCPRRGGDRSRAGAAGALPAAPADLRAGGARRRRGAGPAGELERRAGAGADRGRQHRRRHRRRAGGAVCAAPALRALARVRRDSAPCWRWPPWRCGPAIEGSRSGATCCWPQAGCWS